LLSALTLHYKPSVQQGLLCGNFKCTQEVLGYLSKVQNLGEDRGNPRISRHDKLDGERSRRPYNGPRRDDRARGRENNVNLQFVRRQERPNSPPYRNRRNYNGGNGTFYRRRQGSVEVDSADSLNPDARPFQSNVRPTGHTSGRGEPNPDSEVVRSLNHERI
jgi:hypothetical protein